MGFDFNGHRLCYVDNPRESGAIAKHPRLTRDETGRYIRWFNDPHHERAFRVDVVLRDESGVFEFIERLPRGERRFALRPMTLAAYRRHVMPLVPGARQFTRVRILQRDGDRCKFGELVLSRVSRWLFCVTFRLGRTIGPEKGGRDGRGS